MFTTCEAWSPVHKWEAGDRDVGEKRKRSWKAENPPVPLEPQSLRTFSFTIEWTVIQQGWLKVDIFIQMAEHVPHQETHFHLPWILPSSHVPSAYRLTMPRSLSQRLRCALQRQFHLQCRLYPLTLVHLSHLLSHGWTDDVRGQTVPALSLRPLCPMLSHTNVYWLNGP